MTCTLDDILEIKPRTGRHESQRRTLRMLHERFAMQPIHLVETGTMRSPKPDYGQGDGWATLTWLLWARATGSRVWTCDIDEHAIAICRAMTKDSPQIEYVASDSVAFLRTFVAPIHLLYLDSFDCGPPGDPRVRLACEHQLREAEAAIDKLHERAVVVLDDVPEDLLGGKAELSIPFLLGHGFAIASHVESQVILTRG